MLYCIVVASHNVGNVATGELLEKDTVGSGDQAVGGGVKGGS